MSLAMPNAQESKLQGIAALVAQAGLLDMDKALLSQQCAIDKKLILYNI